MTLQKILQDKEFVEFLKKHKALEKYIKITNGRVACSITSKKDFIISAFPWSQAPEGSRYWRILHSRWLAICNSSVFDKINYKAHRQIIIDRCHRKGACKEEYARLIKTKTKLGFIKVLSDNYEWVRDNDILKNLPQTKKAAK